MRYKYRLIVPTLLSASLFASTLVVSAEEFDENPGQNTVEKHLENNSLGETEKLEKNQGTINTNQVIDTENDSKLDASEELNTNNLEFKNEVLEKNETETSTPQATDDTKNQEIIESQFSEEEHNEQNTNGLDTRDAKTEKNEIETLTPPEAVDTEKQKIIEPQSSGEVQSEQEANGLDTKDTESEKDEIETPISSNVVDNEEQKSPESKTSEEIHTEQEINDLGLNFEEPEKNEFEEEDPKREIQSNKMVDSNGISKDTSINDSEVDIIDKKSKKNKTSENELLNNEINTLSLSHISDASKKTVIPIYSTTQLASKIRSKNNSGLYSPVTSNNSVSAQKFLNTTLFIDREAQYNGNTYYRILNGLDGSMQGWMKANDLNLFHHTTPSNHNKKYYISPDNYHKYLLEEPWGTSKQRIRKLNQFNSNTVFNAEKSMNLGALTYYYGKIGNDHGWVQDKHLQDVTKPLYSDAQFGTKIKNSNNSGLYSPVTSKNSVTARNYLNTTLFIDRQADYNGTTYYRILDGLEGSMQGWMKNKDLNLFHHTNLINHKKQYYINSKNNNKYLLDEPWGTSKQRSKKINQYDSSATFNAEKSIKIGALTYYYGSLGNDYGWIQDKHVDIVTNPRYSQARYAAKIKNSNNSGLYSPVTSGSSVSAENYMNTTLFIDRQANYKGLTYYRILNGLDGSMQGWMKSKDLNLFHHTTPSNHNRNYYIASNKRNQYLLDEPWGTSKQRIKQLNKYNSTSVFNVEKSIALGALKFYFGKIGNDYGWLQDKYLTTKKPSPPVKQPKITTVRYNQSLNQVLNTQMGLGAKPQAWVNGGEWRNATRNEVRNFLDTSHQQGGAWDYTFLNLNQNQGISASVLNQRLLSNRGILTNQGNAFTQASKRHGVNEVYLISHAVLETGHGSSQLAQGVRLNSAGNISSNGKKYYNMYGIGAVDYNALLGGARYAQRMGWDTPEKAIIGGAAFVSQNYFNRGQTTLYSMRWNPRNPGTYQYATDVNWAYATANNLKSYYDALGIRGRYFTRHVF